MIKYQLYIHILRSVFIKETIPGDCQGIFQIWYHCKTYGLIRDLMYRIHKEYFHLYSHI